jgi:hypothetical protein
LPEVDSSEAGAWELTQKVRYKFEVRALTVDKAAVAEVAPTIVSRDVSCVEAARLELIELPVK